MPTFRHLLSVTLGGVLLFSSTLQLPLKSLAESPEEVRRFEILSDADQLYREGNIDAAENLYRQVKPEFPNSASSLIRLEEVYEIEELDGGQKIWQNALDGIEQGIDGKIFFNLQYLTENYPQFIPAHLKLAEFCQEDGDTCEQYAKEGGPKNAIEVLERATDLYPDDPDLLKAKINALAEAQQFLEAFIAARQFSTMFLDYPEAPEFAKLANQYLAAHESKIREQLLGQGITSTILGIGGAILNGDFRQGISGAQTILLMLKGESSFGEQAANARLQEYREQEKLLEDPKVTTYLRGIGSRFTGYMKRDFEYEYYVVKDDSLNAFVLPGGQVFVNTGAILGTNSEAELAGLLAHEIAHAALSHGFLRVAQASLLDNLGQVLPFVDRVSELVNSQYSREQERQADILGTRALASANYAADGLRNFMVTVRKQEGDAPTTGHSTHPATVERVQYLEHLIQSNGYNRFAYEGVKDHREIQELVRGEQLAPDSDLPVPIDEENLQQLEDLKAVFPSEPPSSPISQPLPAAPLPVGTVALTGKARRDNVEIRIEGAKVESTGSFSLNFVIDNQSNRTLTFVPSLADVIDREGNKVAAKFNLLESDSEDIVILPGTTRKGRVRVFGKNWSNSGQQDLTLVIPVRSSIFRISF
ncbi:MAG: M48 family metalloprotease [Symploca sp. SIO2C1]|nr:M48 family metalloprotease [Symploca sp. SIO2C1]